MCTKLFTTSIEISNFYHVQNMRIWEKCCDEPKPCVLYDVIVITMRCKRKYIYYSPPCSIPKLIYFYSGCKSSNSSVKLSCQFSFSHNSNQSICRFALQWGLQENRNDLLLKNQITKSTKLHSKSKISIFFWRERDCTLGLTWPPGRDI